MDAFASPPLPAQTGSTSSALSSEPPAEPAIAVAPTAIQGWAPPPVVVDAPAAAEPTAPQPASLPAPSVRQQGFTGLLLPASFFMMIVLVTLYAVPHLLVHWRAIEAQGEAEAIYLKRRAELKAESEAANERLDKLDKRIVLTSLGFREVVRKVSPIVVNVGNYRELRKDDGLGLGKRVHLHDAEKDRKYLQSGVGSGIIVKPGFVLTNYHVVKNAQRLRITFASGQSVGEDPEAVSADPLTDLAVIRLSSKEGAVRADMDHTAEFADSDKDVQVGDWALAIGSPLGLRQSVSQGVISAKGRLLGMLDLVELLQTDAAINPGNSGGPLFDQLGRVVGINVAIATDNGGHQGIGFAIPSNTARHIFEQLLKKGEVLRGYLGVALEELTPRQTKALGLDGAGAVRITQVLPGEAASKAGLRAGDYVLRYKNELLDRAQPMRHFRQLILDTEPDTQVALEILRDGRHQTLNIEIGKRPPVLPRPE